MSYSDDHWTPSLMKPEDLVGVVSGVVARLPEWVRSDLASKDLSARERAEETLAAMIVAAASASASASTAADEHDPHQTRSTRRQS